MAGERWTSKRNPSIQLMPWYGIGEHPGVCAQHATAEQTTASTAAA
ncbi:hypothetical protein AB0F71_03555 [Kitasatospora sp. NPDC028055]